MTDIISSNGATLGDVMSDLDNIHVNDESSSVPSSDLSLSVSGLSLDGALGGSGSVSLLSGMVTPGPLPDLGAGVGSLEGANAFLQAILHIFIGCKSNISCWLLGNIGLSTAPK